MSTRVRVPAHAVCVCTDSATIIEEAEHKGKNARFARYEGYASDGYASDYQRRPCAWMSCWVEGSKRVHTWRFGGKRFAQADAEYTKMLMQFAERNPNTEATFPTAWALASA